MATGLQHQGIRSGPARAKGVPEHPAGRRIQKTQGQTVVSRRDGSQVATHTTGQRHQGGRPRLAGRGYPNVTQTSRDLINHWTDEEACKPYFAQLDAVLTHIYLNEAATEPVWAEVQKVNDQYNDGIYRIAHKMATATGKTPVMAMLILYHTANHRNAAPRRSPVHPPFPRHHPWPHREGTPPGLAGPPGTTDSDWRAFNLVPPGDRWEQTLTSASVNVINYHQIQPRDAEPTSTKQQQLIDGGANPTTPQEIQARKETPKDVIDRIADGRSQQGPILVINDEGHHCHRGDPDKRNVPLHNTQWF